MKMFAIVGLAMLVTACGQQAGAPSAAPGTQAASKPVVLDLSTPDRALKSIWASADANRKAMCDVKRKMAASNDASQAQYKVLVSSPDLPIKATTGQLTEALNVGVYLQTNCTPIVLRREINEIKSETESRSVAFFTTHDQTPMPEGFKLADSAKEEAEKGTRYKAVFTKVEGQWLLDELYFYSTYSDVWLRLYDEPKTASVNNLPF
ncbi:hypothetical protein [Caulobacter segnis]